MLQNIRDLGGTIARFECEGQVACDASRQNAVIEVHKRKIASASEWEYELDSVSGRD